MFAIARPRQAAQKMIFSQNLVIASHGTEIQLNRIETQLRELAKGEIAILIIKRGEAYTRVHSRVILIHFSDVVVLEKVYTFGFRCLAFRLERFLRFERYLAAATNTTQTRILHLFSQRSLQYMQLTRKKL